MQVAVVSGEEWQRLKKKALGERRNEPAVRKTDREELHERSKRIVKNWENTIEVSQVFKSSYFHELANG